MNIANLFQFITGFILGTIVFTTGIAGGAYFFLTRIGSNPPKPVFPEEQAQTTAQNQSSTPNNNSNNSSPNTNNNQNITTANNTNNNNEDLPPGAYRAKVTWSSGLSLRSEPNKDAERIGGVGYNWELIILSDSDNKEWQKVRIPSSGQEGWIKSGNIEKIN